MKTEIIDNQVFVTVDGETMPAVDSIMALTARRDDLRRELGERERRGAELESNYAKQLAAGESPSRAKIGRVLGDVTKAKKVVVGIEADLSKVHSTLVDRDAQTMIDEALAEIKRDTGRTAGMSEGQARILAEVGVRLAVAAATHAEALAEVKNIDDRTADIEKQISAITSTRLDGNAEAGSAAELTALAHDIRALQSIHGEAVSRAASLDPAALREQYQRLIADWRTHINGAKLKMLADTVLDREKELIDALSKLAGAAYEAGIQNITEVWRPSEQLQTFVGRTLISAMPRAA